MMEVESGSHRGQTILLLAHSTSTNHLLSLLSYLWHYNRYFLSLAITEHTLHRTLEKTFDVKISHHERLHYGKMVAVSVMCMRTGSYTHILYILSLQCPSLLRLRDTEIN